MSDLAMFRAAGDELVPEPTAQSLWSTDQMHGVAISGALGRAVERQLADVGRADLRPARYTVDLFRPARMAPCRTSTTVVREGRRIALIDAVLTQEDVPVARASAVFLAPSQTPAGKVWQPAERPSPPPLDVAPVKLTPQVPFFGSEETGWSQDFGEHQNGSRKSTWQTGLPVVLGEIPTPFQAVAAIADSTSMVTNWGSEGVEYINTDITLALSRPPTTVEVGITAADWVVADGIAVGTATVFDRDGTLGTAIVTSLANAQRTVDFHEHDFTEGAGA